MQTSTQSLPTKSAVTAHTKVCDVTVVERDFGIDATTEVDINHGQCSMELCEDGRILFSAYEGCVNATVRVFESLEDFIDEVLTKGEVA